MPSSNVNNNTSTFYKKLLDSASYLKKKGSSFCLIDEKDLDNIKCDHLKEPVYIAKVLSDGNCAMRAMILAFLVQGIVQDKQSFVADKLCQIVASNKDQAKKKYKINYPSGFSRFIKQYRALTPKKCDTFFKKFLLKNDKIFYFLSACLRLDIFNFCSANYSPELIDKFYTEKQLQENLNRLPVLQSHIDAEFLHFYLQNDHQVSLHVYQVYNGSKELDLSLCHREYDRLLAEQSEKLNLNLIFFNYHFDTVVFKKDIDHYFERNKNKCLEKQSSVLDEPLIKENSFINRQNKQIVNSQDLIQAEDKSTNQPYQSVSKSINHSKGPALESFKSDGSEQLDNRLNEARPPSNDSVFNKQDKKIKVSQDLIQEKDKSIDQSSQGVSESINNSKKPLRKSFKFYRNKYLYNRSNEAYLPSNDSVINKQDKQVAVRKDVTQKRNKMAYYSSKNYVKGKSNYQSSKGSRKIKIKPSEKNNNQLLKKQLDLLTECLFSHDTAVNEISQRNAFLYLIKELKYTLTDPSSRAFLDHLDKKLLKDTRLILNESINSADDLRKHSKNLKEILINHQKNKLNFYSKQKDSKRLLKRLDLIEGCFGKLDELNQGEKFALYSLKKYLKAKQFSQPRHDSLDNLDKELLDKAMLILNRTGESEEQLRKDSVELGKIYNEYKQKKLTRSPGLFSNKNHYSCRLQENQNGLNTDSVACPLVY